VMLTNEFMKFHGVLDPSLHFSGTQSRLATIAYSLCQPCDHLEPAASDDMSLPSHIAELIVSDSEHTYEFFLSILYNIYISFDLFWQVEHKNNYKIWYFTNNLQPSHLCSPALPRNPELAYCVMWQATDAPHSYVPIATSDNASLSRLVVSNSEHACLNISPL